MPWQIRRPHKETATPRQTGKQWLSSDLLLLQDKPRVDRIAGHGYPFCARHDRLFHNPELPGLTYESLLRPAICQYAVLHRFLYGAQGQLTMKEA